MTKISNRALGLMLLWSAFMAPVFGEPPDPKTNLLSFLMTWEPRAAKSRTVWELEPQWVGTVRPVYLRDPEHILSRHLAGDVDIRFTHVAIELRPWNQQTNLTIHRGPSTATGPQVLDMETVFTNSLPSPKAVSEAANLDDLRRMFGRQHGITDAWGDGKRVHWTESWGWFTTATNARLRYLEVCALVSRPKQEDSTPASIDDLCVTEGFFQPADPTSTAERRQYKTAEEVNAEYEARRTAARATYPLPLRALIEAEEAPGDSDMTAYKRALTEFRRRPNPNLLRQLAEALDDPAHGVQPGMVLQALLFDGYLGLEKWDAPQQVSALRALADALSSVRSPAALDHLAILLLQALGGGELKLALPGTTALLHVESRPTANGSVSTFGSQNIGLKDVPLAAKLCADVLKNRYSQLR